MNYKEYLPAEKLRSFIKCYYIFEPDNAALFEDTAYATGCVEMMFNLGQGSWQTNRGDGFKTTSFLELWGQIITPLVFRSIGNNSMVGVRFFPHAASVFLDEDVSLFNNKVTDLAEVSGNPVKELFAKLQDAASIQDRTGFLDAFFLQKLASYETRLKNTRIINGVMLELVQPDFFDNIDNVASRYGITSRYLQKLFVLHTGLTPKLYSKITRFQNSLQLIASPILSLTDVAYECGYFDQSHFIREFKSFTGKTPSGFDTGNTTAIPALISKKVQ